jgi:hypothetical protein
MSAGFFMRAVSSPHPVVPLLRGEGFVRKDVKPLIIIDKYLVFIKMFCGLCLCLPLCQKGGTEVGFLKILTYFPHSLSRREQVGYFRILDLTL